MFSRAHYAFRLHPWMRQSGNLHPAVMLPGLGTAIAIYGTYLFGEALYLRSDLAPDPAAYKPKTYASAFEAGQAAALFADSPSVAGGEE